MTRWRMNTSTPTCSRGSHFAGANFGATFRDCDLRHLKIVDSWLVDASVSGLIGDYWSTTSTSPRSWKPSLSGDTRSAHSSGEMQTADDYRATWNTIERLWSETVDRARRLPEPARYERVDDEWSFIETRRHLVFATDAWSSRTVRDDPMPYHRLR